MKFLPKEIIVAIILGFFIGLIITYGIWNANRALKQKEQVLSPVPGTLSTSPEPELPNDNITKTSTTTKLTIAQPEPHTLTNSKNLTVSGFTQPNANVVLSTETSQQVTVAKADGKFSIDTVLEPGINDLTVSSITDDGQQTSQPLTVVYTTTELAE